MSVRRLMNSNGQKLIATMQRILLPIAQLRLLQQRHHFALSCHSVMTAVIHSLSCIQLHTPGRQVCGTYSREDPRQ